MKYFIGIVIMFFIMNCKQTQNNGKNMPPYYLQEKLKFPIEFANGKITTNNGINFSKDGKILYTSNPIEKEFKNGKHYMGIFQQTYEEDKWGIPLKIDFEIDAYHPVLSIDNNFLFFNSRYHPDSLNLSIKHNIWFSKKTLKGWSKPKMLARINSSNYDSYPTVAKNGNLYFNSDRPGGKGSMDIYVSYYVNDVYQKPINIKTINSTHSENDLVVDPNEQFIIFNRYIDSTREIDMHISFRDNDDWSEPRKLSKINSIDKWELTPTLSPDGKYFFYELNNKIMQIDITELTN